MHRLVTHSGEAAALFLTPCCVMLKRTDERTDEHRRGQTPATLRMAGCEVALSHRTTAGQGCGEPAACATTAAICCTPTLPAPPSSSSAQLQWGGPAAASAPSHSSRQWCAPVGGTTSCSGRAQPLKRRGLGLSNYFSSRSKSFAALEALVRGAYGEHAGALGKQPGRPSSASPDDDATCQPMSPESPMDRGECDHEWRSCWSSAGAAPPTATAGAAPPTATATHPDATPAPLAHHHHHQYQHQHHYYCSPRSGYPMSSLHSAYASDATMYTDSRDSSARGHLVHTPSPPKGDGTMSDVRWPLPLLAR
jgi:hypothetical protein